MSICSSAVLSSILLLFSFGAAAEAQDKKDPSPPKSMTVTHVDAAKGAIAVKYTDGTGKTLEKTYQLTEDVRIFDETGRLGNIAVFQSGDEVLLVESEGRLREVRRAAPQPRRVSDTVQTLIELAEYNPTCTTDLQAIYDMLRKLDTGKNGKVDPTALKAASEQIVQERVKNMFTRLDANKDGKISKDEAHGLIKEHFERIDSNKDGFIDFNELLQAARQRREEQAGSGSGNAAKTEIGELSHALLLACRNHSVVFISDRRPVPRCTVTQGRWWSFGTTSISAARATPLWRHG